MSILKLLKDTIKRLKKSLSYAYDNDRDNDYILIKKIDLSFLIRIAEGIK